MSEAPQNPSPLSNAAAFRGGFVASVKSVFFLVLLGTYIGIGALAQDYGFSPLWVALTTVLVWAGPAQVILISTLGAGAPLFEVALAVGLSGIRLLPMVVALLPVLKDRDTRQSSLIIPAHFTAASMWVESLRLLPSIPRAHRVAFANGLAVGFNIAAQTGGVIGYIMAAQLPHVLTATLLFLTPVTFLVSTARNARMLVDRLALAFGLAIAPALAYFEVGLDLMWTGIIGGTAAYGVHRLRMVMR